MKPRGRVLAALFVLESAALGAPASVEPKRPPLEPDPSPVADATATATAIEVVNAAVNARAKEKTAADATAKAADASANEAKADKAAKDTAAVAARQVANDAKARGAGAPEQAAADATATAAEAAAKKASDHAAEAMTTATNAKKVAETAALLLAAAKAARATLVNVNPTECHGWGLLTPLYGISNRHPSRLDPNKRNELRITGPVASGIGGGYYRPLFDHWCDNDRMWTVEAFAFSEGLDPSKTFQLGVGAGVGLTVFGKFQFGVALGYDLIRLENIETGGVARTYNSGLLLANDVFGCGYGGSGKHWGDAAKCAARNATLLFTFTLTTGSTDASSPKPGTTKSTNASGE